MEELEKTLEGVKYIPISVKDFIEYKKLQQESYKPANLGDETLQPEPFFHGLPDVISNYRRHLLVAHGGKIYNGFWRLSYNEEGNKSLKHYWIDFTEHELKTESDNAFFEKLEGFIIKD